MNTSNKRGLSLQTFGKQNFEKEPECLIIQDTNGEDIMLIPCGAIDGCTLYLESHDPVPPEAGLQGQGRHSGV